MADDENLASLLEMHFVRSREPLILQRYEPAVRQGDKRIVLVDGEAMGVIDRVPESNVTPLAGIQEIARIDGVHLELAIRDRIEARPPSNRGPAISTESLF